MCRIGSGTMQEVSKGRENEGGQRVSPRTNNCTATGVSKLNRKKVRRCNRNPQRKSSTDP